MYFLKKFNELKSGTYRSAARGLASKGYKNRAIKLSQWADKLDTDYSDKMKFLRWSENLKKNYKYGLVRCKFDTKQHVLDGDFVIQLNFDGESTEESLYEFKENIGGDMSHKGGSNPGSRLRISFYVCFIPADEETFNSSNGVKLIGPNLTKTPDKIEQEFNDGYYHGFRANVDFIAVDGEMSIEGISLEHYDRKNTFHYNRRMAVVFKKHLLECFDPDSKYPLGLYWDFYEEEFMYNAIHKLVCDEGEISLNFNYTMDNFYEDIREFSINDIELKYSDGSKKDKSI